MFQTLSKSTYYPHIVPRPYTEPSFWKFLYTKPSFLELKRILVGLLGSYCITIKSKKYLLFPQGLLNSFYLDLVRPHMAPILSPIPSFIIGLLRQNKQGPSDI